MNSSLDAVLPLLRKHARFVLTTHVNPDGDGLGSEVALALALRLCGKTADILNHSPTPAVYDFLDPERQIRTYDSSRDASLLASADVILILDTNHPDRLRSMQNDVLASPAVKICIDHHLEPAPFADHYIIDDDATSTGEIVYHLLNALLGGRLPPAVAEALYTAIMTDTGSFRYPRVDAETHETIAHLLRCGADPVRIYSLVYERWTNGRIHLLGEMLAHIKLASGGKIAHVAVSRRMLEKTRTTEEDTDNFTSYLMSIEGVLAGILFLELPRGVKISFRSRGDIPINELAKEFGGNGHKNAAGARLEDATLPDTEHTVIHAAARYV
jgi:phosphoesterase RecJ-like protein